MRRMQRLAILPLFGLELVAAAWLLFAPGVAQAHGAHAAGRARNAAARAGQNNRIPVVDGVIVVDGQKYSSLATAVTAACNGSKPGTLRLPPGTYPLASPVAIPSNCAIGGPRSAIVAPQLNFGAFKNVNPVSNVTFEGFTLTTSGISLPHGGDHITIRNMKFTATASTAVNIVDPASNILIEGNVCENPATYFCFAIGSSSGPDPGDHDWNISNNHMAHCAGNCILVQGGSGITIQGNTISGCGDTCIEVGMGTSLASVTGNSVDLSDSSLDLTLVGISTRSSRYAVVSGNKVVGNSSNRKGELCYLGWHGSAPGETQLNEYVTYVGNECADCPKGLKFFQTNHVITGANHLENNATPVTMDRARGGASDWTQLENTAASAPTISSGFGSGASIPTNYGPAVFTVNVGHTGGTATSGAIGLPEARDGWLCVVSDQTTPAAHLRQTASAANSITLTNYDSTGKPAAWADMEILIVGCFAKR
jgi:parallel beta-helix repeat protein